MVVLSDQAAKWDSVAPGRGHLRTPCVDKLRIGTASRRITVDAITGCKWLGYQPYEAFCFTGHFAAVRVLAFAAMVWIPLQYLHGKNHDWAFGSPDALVWLLMIFDSIVVGLIATLAGTAIHHGSLPLRAQLKSASETSAKAGV